MVSYSPNDWWSFLQHNWGTKPEQKAAERKYNHEYWEEHKEEIMKKRRARNSSKGDDDLSMDDEEAAEADARNKMIDENIAALRDKVESYIKEHADSLTPEQIAKLRSDMADQIAKAESEKVRSGGSDSDSSSKNKSSKSKKSKVTAKVEDDEEEVSSGSGKSSGSSGSKSSGSSSSKSKKEKEESEEDEEEEKKLPKSASKWVTEFKASIPKKMKHDSNYKAPIDDFDKFKEELSGLGYEKDDDDKQAKQIYSSLRKEHWVDEFDTAVSKKESEDAEYEPPLSNFDDFYKELKEAGFTGGGVTEEKKEAKSIYNEYKKYYEKEHKKVQHSMILRSRPNHELYVGSPNDWWTYLSHSWGTRPEQKQAEQQYNHEYYERNKERILAARKAHGDQDHKGEAFETSDNLNDKMISEVEELEKLLEINADLGGYSDEMMENIRQHNQNIIDNIKALSDKVSGYMKDNPSMSEEQKKEMLASLREQIDKAKDLAIDLRKDSSKDYLSGNDTSKKKSSRKSSSNKSTSASSSEKKEEEKKDDNKNRNTSGGSYARPNYAYAGVNRQASFGSSPTSRKGRNR